MTLLGAIAKRSLEDPKVSLSDPSLAEWLSGGRTAAGVSVTEQRVYGLSAYLRAITLVAGTMASLPLKIYETGTRTRVVSPTPLDNPNPAQTPFEFKQTLYANALGWGNAYAWKERSPGDVVRRVWSLHPKGVRLEIVEANDRFPDGKKFHVRQMNGTTVVASSKQVMHLPYLAPDGRVGVSPLQAARTTLGTGIAAEEFSANFYANGAHVSGILTTEQKLDQPVADRLKARWKERHTGVRNSHDIAVLDAGAKYERVGIAPGDAQLLDSRKFTVTEIARMFGIPPHLLGDVTGSTSWGTGIEQQTIGFVVYSLQPWLTMLEQRYTRELLPGGWTQSQWYAEHALEGLLRGDSKSRGEFYRVLINAGIITPNEARAFENLEQQDGLDVFFFPKNVDVIDPTERASGAEKRLDLLGLTTAMQRIYLAVTNGVIDRPEAREFLNRAGAELDPFAPPA